MNTLKICFWNANGIRQHKSELAHFLIDQQIDVMLISETHLTSRSLFKIHGYTLYDTKDPRDRACGGSAILIKSRLKHHQLCNYCEDYMQATNICIDESHRNLVISAIYCPPRHQISKDQFCNFYKSLGDRFMAAGDYNAKHTYWGSRLITPKGRVLYDVISKIGLNVISSGQPTYWPTDRQKIPDVIDFGVIKGIPIDFIQVESSLDLSSDHSPSIVTIRSFHETDSSPGSLTAAAKRINWLKYKKYLSTHCSEDIALRTTEDVDFSISNLEETIKAAAENATTYHQQSRYNRISSAEVERLVSEKRRARREWQQHRSPQSKTKLKDCTKRLRELLQKKKTENLENYLKHLDATPQSDYSLWRATRNLKRPTIRKPPLRTLSGDWAMNDTEKTNLFVNHLKTVFTPNESTNIVELPSVVNEAAVPLRFELRDLKKTIGDLNCKKSPGFDKISNKMLLELPETILRVMLYIFNAILRLAYFPRVWKVSLITLIPKPGKDHTKAESYRPISLLSNVSKLFEKLLTAKIQPILDEKGSIPNHQFGFRRQHSTTEQTHRLVNVVKQAFEEKKYCSALFIDVSQAFDKVWHKGLIHKIRLNFPENIFKLLESYLTNRQFIVKQGDIISSSQSIQAGVPQGSVLGPLLYLIYTSDMPTTNSIHTSTFADDTAFLSVHESPQEASRILQEHIYKLERWLKKWRIKVNEQKCSHITFTLRRETCAHITINSQMIPQQTNVKYLGIHLDRRLTWKCHIEAKLIQMKLKAIQINWLIGRNSTLSLDCKLLLYNSILKPIWSYGIQLWGAASASNVDKIQRRQNKTLRMITAAPWYIKNSNIHKDLEVPTVKAEISKYASTYLTKLADHPNPLARNILHDLGYTRLKRRDVSVLSRTRDS